jgi:hypothetical protein
MITGRERLEPAGLQHKGADSYSFSRCVMRDPESWRAVDHLPFGSIAPILCGAA